MLLAFVLLVLMHVCCRLSVMRHAASTDVPCGSGTVSNLVKSLSK